MSTTEIKKTKSDLIEWIEQLSDSSMLSFLDSLREMKTSKDWWDDLSEPQKKHINEGLDDAENGRIISSKEFWDHQKND